MPPPEMTMSDWRIRRPFGAAWKLGRIDALPAFWAISPCLFLSHIRPKSTIPASFSMPWWLGQDLAQFLITR
jgi:hypothetical protein